MSRTVMQRPRLYGDDHWDVVSGDGIRIHIHARCDSESDARWLAARDDVVEALRNSIKRCSLCSGTGSWETHCPLCGDSTYDHECQTETHPCGQCLLWRDALAKAGVKP